MELAALAATSAGTGTAAAAAGSAIGPVTAAASGMATIGSTLSVLSTGLSLASMASDIFGGASAGKSAGTQLMLQAQQDMLNSKQEALAGQQEANDIQDNLLQTIAQQRLAYSGAGIDFSFGSPAALEKNLSKRAEMQFGTSRDNAQMKTLARRREAYLKLSQVGQAQSAPLLAGISSAGKTFAGMIS